MSDRTTHYTYMKDGRAHSRTVQPKWLQEYQRYPNLKEFLRIEGFIRNWVIGVHCLYFRHRENPTMVTVVDRSSDLEGFQWSSMDHRKRMFIVSQKTFDTPEDAMRDAESFYYR